MHVAFSIYCQSLLDGYHGKFFCITRTLLELKQRSFTLSSFSTLPHILTCFIRVEMAENDNTAKPGPNENLENKNESAEAEGYFKYFFNIIQNFWIEFSGVIAHPTPEPPDPNEPQPTQVPEIQLKVQTSEEQTNKFANLVQTMMVMEFNLIILYNEHYQYIGYGNLL